MSKRGDVTSDKTVTYILIGIALAVIIGFIISFNPNVLYKFFPNYNTAQEDTDQVISDSDLLVNGCGVDGIVVGKMESAKIFIKNDLNSGVLKATNMIFEEQTNVAGVRATISADAGGGIKSAVNLLWQKFDVAKINSDGSIIVYFTDATDRLLLYGNLLNFNIEQLAILASSQYHAGFFCGKKTSDYEQQVNGLIWGSRDAKDIILTDSVSKDAFEKQGYFRIDLSKYIEYSQDKKDLQGVGYHKPAVYGTYVKKDTRDVFAIHETAVAGQAGVKAIGQISQDGRIFFYCDRDKKLQNDFFFSSVSYKNGLYFKYPVWLSVSSGQVSTYPFRCDSTLIVKQNFASLAESKPFSMQDALTSFESYSSSGNAVPTSLAYIQNK